MSLAAPLGATAPSTCMTPQAAANVLQAVWASRWGVLDFSPSTGPLDVVAMLVVVVVVVPPVWLVVLR